MPAFALKKKMCVFYHVCWDCLVFFVMFVGSVWEAAPPWALWEQETPKDHQQTTTVNIRSCSKALRDTKTHRITPSSPITQDNQLSLCVYLIILLFITGFPLSSLYKCCFFCCSCCSFRTCTPCQRSFWSTDRSLMFQLLLKQSVFIKNNPFKRRFSA